MKFFQSDIEGFMSGSWFSDETRLTQVRSEIKEVQKEGRSWEIETIVLSGEPETGGSLRKAVENWLFPAGR